MSVDAQSRAVERARLVEQLGARGIRDSRVLRALQDVPREQFLPPALTQDAYDDRALPIECEQTISQPFIVAWMTAQLDVHPQHRVLEIGTGSGYQTAILAALAGHVWSIERHADLLRLAAGRLARLGVTNITLRIGDGSLGWVEHAPFDRILVAAGAPEMPPALVEQLAADGRIVIPLGPTDEQVLTVFQQTPEGLRRDATLSCRFVPLRGAAGWD